MKTLLIFLGGIVYLLVLLALAAIVLARLAGVGVWYKGDGIGYATEIPAYLSAVCIALIILLVGGGIYFLRRRGAARLS